MAGKEARLRLHRPPRERRQRVEQAPSEDRGQYRAGMAFEPRSMISSPSAFGSVPGDVPPADGIVVTDHRYRAAIIQHRIARSVHAYLRYSEKSLPRFLADFDGVPGLSLDRQRRMLRGETSASFADLTFWAGEWVGVAHEVMGYLEGFRPQGVRATAPAETPAAPAKMTVAPAARPPLR